MGDRRARTTLASFDVATSAAVSENRLGEVVAALEQAANEALTQVIERSAAAVAGAAVSRTP